MVSAAEIPENKALIAQIVREVVGLATDPNGPTAEWIKLLKDVADGMYDPPGGMLARELEPYPEHVKMHAVVAETEAAGAFVDWLSERTPALHLLHIDERYTGGPGRWCTPDKPLLGLLAEWKGIDLDKIEQEKLAMIAAMRAANGAR